MAQLVLELDNQISTFRKVGKGPSPFIDWFPSTFGPGDYLEIVGPLLRTYEGVETVVIAFCYSFDEDLEECYLMFSELSAGKQRELQQMFPECPLLMSVH